MKSTSREIVSLIYPFALKFDILVGSICTKSHVKCRREWTILNKSLNRVVAIL